MSRPQEFIEDFRALWERAYESPEQASLLVPFFHVPCTIVGGDGSISYLEDSEGVLRFLQERLDAFLEGGVVHAKVWGVDVHTLADYSCLLMLNWELRRADQSIERSYRICYNLILVSDEWKILLSTYQSGS